MVCSATWSANTPEALVTAIFDSMTDGSRQWSIPAAEDWIHWSLPFWTTASQSTGTLAWPQKMSAWKISSAMRSLAGIDDLGLGGRGGDLPDMFRFDRIAKNNAHHKSLSEP